MKRKTLREIYPLWCRQKKLYVKQSSIATYVLLMEKHVIPVFGDQVTVKESEVQDFVIRLLDSGLKNKTVKDIILVLKMLVRYSATIQGMPMFQWKLYYPANTSKTSIDVLSPHDHRKLMQFLLENISFRNIGIYICLSAGLRIGEICALKWKDIDVKTGVIRVQRTLERIYFREKDGWTSKVLSGAPKTESSYREVPMTKDLLRIIRPLLRIMSPEAFVITGRLTPLEPHSYRHYFYSVCRKLHLPRIRFHGLRHSFATRCIESGCDYKTVSALLGHAQIGTTLNLYVHPDLEQKKRCIDRLTRHLAR